MKTLSYLGLLTCFLTSCSITKCRYRNGFNIDLRLGKKQDKVTIIKQKQLKLKSLITLGEKTEIVDSCNENNYQITPIEANLLDSQYHIIYVNKKAIKQETFFKYRTQKFAQKIVHNNLNKSNTKKDSKPTKTRDVLIEVLKVFIFLLAIIANFFIMSWFVLLLFTSNLFLINPWLSVFILLITSFLLSTLLMLLAQYFGYDLFVRRYKESLPFYFFITLIVLLRILI